MGISVDNNCIYLESVFPQTTSNNIFPFKSEKEAAAFINNSVVRKDSGESCLINTEEGLTAYLELMDRNGEIIWGEENIYKFIQGKIKEGEQKKTIILVGNEHGLTPQQEYINKLFDNDQIGVFAYELLSGKGKYSKRADVFTDNICQYNMINNQDVASQETRAYYLNNLTFPYLGMCQKTEKVGNEYYQGYVDSVFQSFAIARKNGVPMLPLGLHGEDAKRITMNISPDDNAAYNKSLFNSLREYYMAGNLVKGAAGKTTVSFLGALHARKNGLTRFIDKKINLFSVQISGGVYNQNKKMDVVINKMKKNDGKWGQAFAIKINNNVLGDLLIQLPFNDSPKSQCVFRNNLFDNYPQLMPAIVTCQ